MMPAILHRPRDEDDAGERHDVPATEAPPKRLRIGVESFVLAGIADGVAHYRRTDPI